MDLPSSREDAKKIGSKRFFTGTACRKGHVAPRYTRNCNCCECMRLDRNEYRAKNIDRLRQQDREYARLNSAKRIEASNQWRKQNADKHLATISFRRAAKKQAVPKWLSKEQRHEIAKIYALSQWMANATGENFEVDHIYPLNSDFMCGLHLPSNLIVLSASDNARKSNTWWPGQLDCQKGRGASHEWWKKLQQADNT